VRNRLSLFLVAGLIVAGGLAIFVSPYASTSPDGLNRVADSEGFHGAAKDHPFGDGPVADYSVNGVENPRVSKALAGLAGVMITFGAGIGLFALLRRLRAREQR
jgi:PDGLE domain